MKIVHTGTQDWSFPQERRVPVQPGDIYELHGWVRVNGEGRATLGVVLYGAESKVLDWSYGGRSASATQGWQELRTRFIIPPEAREIWPRLIGDGPSSVGLDDVTLVRSASLAELRGKELAEAAKATSKSIELVFHTQDATFSVTDRATGRQWTQQPQHTLVVVGVREVPGGIDARLLDPAACWRSP